MKFIFTFLFMISGLVLQAQCDYEQNFDSYNVNQYPTDWALINTTGSASSGITVQTSANAPSPQRYLRMTNGTSTTGQLLAILPMIANASDGNHRIRFYLQGSTNPSASLQIGTMDTNTAAGVFTPITTITTTTTTAWTQYTVQIPAGTNQYIAFKHGLGAAGIVYSFDNICFQQTPTCLEIPNLTFNSATSSSVTFGWAATPSGETAWQYIVQPTGTAAPTAATNGIDTTTNPQTEGGLSANTAYDVYVRAKCSDTDFGEWFGPVLATTACVTYTASYSDSFENNVSTQDIKPCWSIHDTGSGDLKAFASNNSFGITPSEGALHARFFFPSTMVANSLALISPQFTDLASNKQIRFKMNKRAGFEANMNIEIGTVASPTDMSSFTLLDNTTITQATVVASTWNEYTVTLSNYNNSLGHQYIAFRPKHLGGTTATQYIYMDEFVYESAPFNDETLTAFDMNVSTSYECTNSVNSTFANATRSANAPCNSPIYSSYKDLWYKFVAPTTGDYAFSLELSNTNPINGQLFVFQGPATSLTQITSGCLTRYLIRALTAGQEYFVSVACPDNNASFNLCVFPLGETPNDDIIDAEILTESANRACENAIEGTLETATHSSDSACAAASVDVWYKFTPSQTDEYTFYVTLLNGTSPTGITIYGGNPGALVAVSDTCAGPMVLANLNAGTMYYVAVSASTTSNPIHFNLCAYQSPPPPSNDDCTTPINLIVGQTFNDNDIVATNTSAGVNPGNSNYPSCGTIEFSTYGRDVWFTVTMPESGNLVIETRREDGSLLSDTAMETYTGSCGTATLAPYYYNLPPPNPGQAYCNDQFVIGGNQYAGIRFANKMPGEQIIVRVWGWARQYGDFKISAYDDTEPCPRPTNINITDIVGGQVTATWNPPTPSPNGYYYIIQPAPLNYPSGQVGTYSPTNSATESGLAEQYEYEIYVRSACNTNNSAWEGPIPFTTTLGTADFNNSVFAKIYPNPANDLVKIESSQMIDEVALYSIEGKLVYSKVINEMNPEINVSHLQSDVYFLKVISDKDVMSVKLIKR
ncbi:T9SS-dependent choice-of-anchor J family protein [Flavobacterium sp.]|uniref:T9SS-dependent choice-of-anchor J family protein n=1 Tax=Flavobacterium sp. TaxID=239 RepID=UPI0028BE1AAF|nr:choice-of-anchor J domain-containing protein [Flavobacterium sp.]